MAFQSPNQKCHSTKGNSQSLTSTRQHHPMSSFYLLPLVNSWAKGRRSLYTSQMLPLPNNVFSQCVSITQLTLHLGISSNVTYFIESLNPSTVIVLQLVFTLISCNAPLCSVQQLEKVTSLTAKQKTAEKSNSVTTSRLKKYLRSSRQRKSDGDVLGIGRVSLFMATPYATA